MSAKEATVLAKTQSEDSQKNHEVSQKKLLSHEAQCISSLLENCIGQVEIAATLPALHSVSDVVDKELRGAIKEHQILIGRLETLEGLKQESDREQEGEAGEARAQLEKDIKNSVRDLLRVARVHPEAICGLRAELGMKVGESEYMLIKGLERFHSHVVEKLLTGLDDEELQQVLHKQVSLSPDHNAIAVSLEEEEEVAAAIKQLDAKISCNNNKLKKCQRSLKGIAEEPGMSLLADKQYQSHMKSAKMKQTGIQQEIDQLNSQLNDLTPKNRQAEREIQEKNEKLVEEIEYMLQIFDDDMGKKQADLEMNAMDYEGEEELLRKLEKPFSALELECNEIQEKRRLADEKRREEMRELELKTKAAILVQAVWRGYITRKSLKNKGISKKAKKGKKKTKLIK
ncbi:dynein regulatory complex protein 10 [Anarrhichthys ocellatus]|uniref:dynein regulatory complex protein 10 n=1 Tax=Anarrhichthys ocellatus TaxID=433405 RepID=UPI0012EDE8D2|nr:dynein regulatory complex protein 10 [Anarrhichthys ocellatus]